MRIPILFEMTNKTVIAVGGGAVAAKKLKHFIGVGADITIIAPSLHPALQQLYENGQIQWQKREVREEEQFDSLLLLLMTEKKELNQSLYEKKLPHQLVYVANDAQKSDIHFPATLQKGPLTMALSTDGASPAYTKQLKNRLAEQLPADIEGDLYFLKQARKIILADPSLAEQKKQLLQQISTEEFLRQENRDQLLEAMLEDARQ
ncbi:bifunctional precorrin-2 dehydrogenase/sirohydrochlorin ferrochelatase [Oceanobacillus sp. J11TS1]|uniref:precorrin-2 dehydrogenase/sirohydrochlorin ferrochelatase family protein n=1 Tax=Oceanobacillus sp. J11TS1 TaxID=2807191 RepID=UPI001B158117|nr:NAD(P)-dependent oxidoreductase [Oceanobacillus sp. J11TS1]GIO23694.1 NAD(P)-binding protein [Oceanobacillus sp. J11TS1]